MASPIIAKQQNIIINFIFLTVKHKPCPVTNEIQSFELIFSYFKLTIVLAIPNSKIGIVKIQIIKKE